MFKNILVPTDGSELSQNTVRRAISFAKEAGAHITAFYAKPLNLDSCYDEGIFTEYPPISDKVADELAIKILGFVEQACRESGVPCTTVTTNNNIVYEAIIDAADKNHCDLIFMASHGRRGIGALLLGSETTKVLTHTTIPVLVYR